MYAFIEQHRQAFSVQRMCTFLSVDRSGYYTWRQRGGEPSPRRRQAIINQRVAQAFEQARGAQALPG
ncbi:hypothetical protein GCM10008094_20060 [Aidingimonas halophila]|nr:hypothetical protein GCM10008094_20060 [Aidingimonas halophila]